MTFDVAVFQPFTTPNDQRFLGEESYALTGIRKLAQRFIIELLQPAGSIPFAADRGSPLLQAVRDGKIRNEYDAYMMFGYAVSKIEPTLVAVETDLDPLEERYLSSAVSRVIFRPKLIVYEVSLTSRAGTSRPLSFPVTKI